jgi:hypothetical protein
MGYKPFLLEVADYLEGMILEKTPEENDVEANDDDDDDDPSHPISHAPRRHPVVRLLGDMRSNNMRQLFELEKRNIYRNPAVCMLFITKRKHTRYIYLPYLQSPPA